jgi:Uma2 family endonuclease
MSAAVERAFYTPEDLLRLPDGAHYELVGGELRERRMGFLASLVVNKVARLLGEFVERHGLGWTPASECGYRCFPWAPDQVRRPDASYLSRARLSPSDLEDVGFQALCPDLAVEVVSTNDLFKEVAQKAEEYLRAGVRLVWVVEPTLRVVYVYRPDGTVSILREHERLTGETVLPGFECAVADLFPWLGEEKYR